MELQKDDMIYVFTDGYADQFGGTDRKKFMYKRFQELIIKVSAFEMSRQKEYLENTFDEWRGNFKQIDDVLVIGIKV
jgi:serine phosphatase RsbU (regulator of sigma subunit)